MEEAQQVHARQLGVCPVAVSYTHLRAHETGSGTDELHTTLDLIETDLHTTFSDQERITLIDQAVTERQQLETEAAP